MNDFTSNCVQKTCTFINRVLRTKNLRVIDASIMPTIPNANTNAPSMMLAEQGADFILEYWESQKLVCDYQDYYLYRDKLKCYYLH